MAGDVLGGLCKRGRAGVLQVLGTGLVRAGDLHETMVEGGDVQVIKPLAHIHRVDGLDPVQNIVQNFSCTLLDETVPFFPRSDILPNDASDCTEPAARCQWILPKHKETGCKQHYCSGLTRTAVP